MWKENCWKTSFAVLYTGTGRKCRAPFKEIINGRAWYIIGNYINFFGAIYLLRIGLETTNQINNSALRLEN